MIEPEMAFCTLDDDMQCAEDYVRHCCRHVLDTCGPDLAFLGECAPCSPRSLCSLCPPDLARPRKYLPPPCTVWPADAPFARMASPFL